MKVGFLNNQIDNRGTGNAVFDYAHYNEEILGNKSLIFTFENASHNPLAVQKYIQRFDQIIPIDIYKRAPTGVDVLYHIKSGHDDGFRISNDTRYAVHAVFERNPHGDRFATISHWLSAGITSFVPHIIALPDSKEDLRANLGIPQTATVFGRHGGDNSFDIEFVPSVLESILNFRNDIWLLFLNTELNIKHPRVIYLNDTADALEKRKFINTCDAMIHARARGETFGIAVGEFAHLGKPVFTYAYSGEKAHLEELSEKYLYTDKEDLYLKLLFFNRGENIYAYTQYTPENVMVKFKEVFLD